MTKGQPSGENNNCLCSVKLTSSSVSRHITRNKTKQRHTATKTHYRRLPRLLTSSVKQFRANQGVEGEGAGDLGFKCMRHFLRKFWGNLSWPRCLETPKSHSCRLFCLICYARWLFFLKFFFINPFIPAFFSDSG